MNYQNLTAAINAVIKTNNRREITGQILQNVLGQMVGSLGENFQLAGLATPTTNPGEPDQNVFYFAKEQGVYSYFDDIQLEGGLHVLKWKNGSWTVDTLTSGIVTREWVDSNYVSIAFFRQLFRAYNSSGVEIYPNDTTGIVDNIKAMVGLWTDRYLSALGLDPGGGGGGGGASSLSELLDVTLTNLQDGQALIYSSALGKWTNGTAGVNMTQVWSALGSSTNEQINASHLTTALSGYATQTWVGQNYISIAYFDRLFRAYNGSTLVNHNDTTTTIDNIKSMFGFWTDFYLSALGNGGQAGGAIYLSQLADVVLSSPTNGQALIYDAANSQWVNGTIQTGVSTLSSLTDVLLTSPTANQVLIWDESSSKWVNSSLKTVNGYSVIGSGDIPASGGTTGNYLPLAGGTMTGTINSTVLTASLIHTKSNKNVVIIGSGSGTASNQYGIVRLFSLNDVETIRFYANTDSSSWINSARLGLGTDSPLYRLDVRGNIAIGSPGTSGTMGCIYSSDNNNMYNYIVFNAGYGGLQYFGGIFSGGTSTIAHRFHTNGHTALTILNNGNVGLETNSPAYKLDVYGEMRAFTSLHVSVPQGNEIARLGTGSSNPSGTYTYAILQMYHTNVEKIRLYSAGESWINGGNLGIGTTSPSYTLHVVGNIYSTGAVTALSDIRHKTVIKDAAVSVEDIARMPAVMYQWNDGREDNGLHVGSIAQDWQTVLPEVVLRANDKEGTLSMQYGVAALVSSIITARKVVDHERRIAELERENKELKLKLKIA